MVTCVHQSQTLSDLRRYINETLCHQYDLLVDAFKMTERILSRSGQVCGMYFCLHGPRAVKFIAIWETERNCILFYGSNGERFQKTELLEAPGLDTGCSRDLQAAAA